MKKLLSIFFVVLAAGFSASAQPVPPPPPNVGIPLDLIVPVLLVVGLLYGVFKLGLGPKRTKTEKEYVQ